MIRADFEQCARQCLCLKFLKRAGCQKPAILYQTETGTDFLRVAKLMGTEEDGDILILCQFPDQMIDILGAFRVKTGCGFIEEEDFRPVDQSPGPRERRWRIPVE